MRISLSYSKVKENLISAEERLKQAEKTVSQASSDITALKVIVENNSRRDEEERLKASKKFDELYASKNKTNEVLTELNTTIKMMITNFDNQFKNLDKKIDELKRG